MRAGILAALVVSASLATPALAAKNKKIVRPAPTWMDCFNLSVVRGTDAEPGEQRDFIEACLAGRIPFG